MSETCVFYGKDCAGIDKIYGFSHIERINMQKGLDFSAGSSSDAPPHEVPEKERL